MSNLSDSAAPPALGASAGGGLSPLRILTFTTLYPNSQQPNHGIFVENRLRHLVASGEVVSTVIAPVPYFPFHSPLFGHWSRYAGVPSLEERHGLVIHHPRYPAIPWVGMSVSPALLNAGALGLAQKLHSAGPGFDIIDAHYFYPDGVAAVRLGRRLGLPVVITSRGTDINLIPQYRIPRRQIQRTILEADGLIAVSAALKDALVELGADPDGVQVLRNGVDLDLFRPMDRVQARCDLGLSRPTLVSVGHLIQRKGHDRVIEALRGLPEFELLIVGDGPERDRLTQLVRHVGVADRVRFLGSVGHATLPAIYTAADALVLASSREGWANVLLEAMACGTPVVASNIWGNPEVVQLPEAGLIFKENTPDHIADAVRALFAHLPARALTRAYAERFSWDDVTAGQLALFRHLVEPRRRRPTT